MMNCRDVETFLDDYLDGSLPWPTLLRFKVHVSVCAECKLYIARYKCAIELGQRLLAPSPDAPADDAVPPELVDVILASIQGED